MVGLGNRDVDSGLHRLGGQAGVGSPHELDERQQGITRVHIRAGATTGASLTVAERHVSLLATTGADLRTDEARRAEPLLASPLHRRDLAVALGAARRRDGVAPCSSEREEEVADNPRCGRSAGGEHPRNRVERERQPPTFGPPAADLLDDSGDGRPVEGRIGELDRSDDGAERIEEEVW